MAMSLFTTNAYAQLQEVRGIETRKVEYVGNYYSDGKLYDWDKNILMYGFEIHNTNSCTVSVDIELYFNCGEKEELVTTKSVTLKPGETYLFKQESRPGFRKDNHRIDCFYIRYKAYKVQ